MASFKDVVRLINSNFVSRAHMGWSMKIWLNKVEYFFEYSKHLTAIVWIYCRKCFATFFVALSQWKFTPSINRYFCSFLCGYIQCLWISRLDLLSRIKNFWANLVFYFSFFIKCWQSLECNFYHLLYQINNILYIFLAGPSRGQHGTLILIQFI